MQHWMSLLNQVIVLLFYSLIENFFNLLKNNEKIFEHKLTIPMLINDKVIKVIVGLF